MAKISAERQAALKKEKSKNLSGGSFYKMKKGQNEDSFRIMPPKEESEPLARRVGDHYITGRTYICPAVTFGKPCAACTAASLIAQKGSGADKIANKMKREAREKEHKGLLDSLRARVKYWMKIIARSEEGRVQIYKAPKSVYEVPMNVMNQQGEDVTHPTEGRDFFFERSGTGLETEYTVTPAMHPSPIVKDPAKRKALIAQAHDMDLDDMLECRDEELTNVVAALTEGIVSADELTSGVPDDEPEPDVDADAEAEADADAGDDGEETSSEDEATEETEDGGDSAEAGDELVGSVVTLTSEESGEEYTVTGVDGDVVSIEDAKGKPFQVDISEVEVVSGPADSNEEESEGESDGSEDGGEEDTGESEEQSEEEQQDEEPEPPAKPAGKSPQKRPITPPPATRKPAPATRITVPLKKPSQVAARPASRTPARPVKPSGRKK